MARRPDRSRVDRARRAGAIYRHMAAEGIELEVAEAWCEKWRSVATLPPADPRFWDEGYRWIRAQRAMAKAGRH